jgi:hypothetical protein
LGEAIEEEVRDHQVVGWGWHGEDAGIGASCRHPAQLALLCDASAKHPEHRRRSVDGIRMEMGCSRKQARQESAIAVAENQSAASIEKRRNVVEAAALQEWAKRQILHRAVEACDTVETRRGVAGEITSQSGDGFFECREIRNAS